MQIATAVAQPVASIQPAFDLYRGSPKPRTNFFPSYAPEVSFPAYRVVLSHSADHAHTQDFFQALFAPQLSMGIAWISRCHRKTLLPLRKKVRLQKVIRGFDAIDSRQTHFLHQAVLQGGKQPLDASFGLRALCGDPFDSQFLQGSPKLRAGLFSPELFADGCRTVAAEDAIFIRVMCQGTPIAP